MEGFYGCKPQCVWEEEDPQILKAVAANTLTAVVSAKGCAVSPALFPSHFTALWSTPCKCRGVEIARNLEGPVSVPVVKLKSHLPFPTSACRIFPQQLPGVPGFGDWYVKLHCCLLCRLPLNIYSRQRKLKCECHCDVPVDTSSLLLGGGTCVLQTHYLSLHSPHWGTDENGWGW